MLKRAHYAGVSTGLCLELSVWHAEPFSDVPSQSFTLLSAEVSILTKNLGKRGCYYPKKVY